MGEMAAVYPVYGFERHKGVPHPAALPAAAPVRPLSHPPPDLPEKAVRGGDRTSLGLWGEKQAARYLRKQGFRVLETRFRCREGEIDLVVSRGPYLCFVEVKLRRDAEMAEAREFGHPGKAAAGPHRRPLLLNGTSLPAAAPV